MPTELTDLIKGKTVAQSTFDVIEKRPVTIYSPTSMGTFKLHFTDGTVLQIRANGSVTVELLGKPTTPTHRSKRT